MTSKPGFLKFITTTKSTKLFETNNNLCQKINKKIM